MDIFLMICGAVAAAFSIVYIALRLEAWASGRRW